MTAMRFSITTCAVLLWAGCTNTPDDFEYPATRQVRVVEDYHGTAVADSYRWLESLDSEETQAWIGAQNALAEPYLRGLPSRAYFVERLRALRDLVPPPVPERQGTHWVVRTRGADGTPLLLVHDTLDAPPRERVDLSALEPEPDTVLRSVRLSPDGRYIAYSLAPGNGELTEIRVRDLRSGRDVDDRIPGVDLEVFHWMSRSDGLVYGRYLQPGTETDDGVNREPIIAVHLLGTPASDDKVLYRADPAGDTAVAMAELSSDGRFVLLKDYVGVEGRFWIQDLQDADDPRFDAPAVQWGSERHGRTVLIGSSGTTLFLRTSRSAPNNQVVAVDGTDPTAWRTIVPESEHLLEDVVLVGGHLVTSHRRDVKSALAVHTLDGTKLWDIELPADGSVYGLSGGADHPALTFGFDSFAHAPAAFHHDVRTGTTVQLGSSQLDIDSSDYVTRQVFFSSNDGTRVPMFVTHRADRPADATSPTLLFGYGSAGHVQEPVFNDEWFAWIEAGGVMAVANVRGGGEYGEAWRLAGARANKQNTFDDFIAAAESLVREGYTKPAHLAVNGFSDGGLLIGAVMTQRPDLFAAALPEAGVLDALRNPLFAVGPHWVTWTGDPSIREEFSWLYAWSPQHAIQDGTCYPATFITTAEDDPRVHPSQSYRFAARLQVAQSCDRPVLLRVHPTGGHSKGLDAEDRLGRSADLLAFAAHHTGLSVPGR